MKLGVRLDMRDFNLGLDHLRRHAPYAISRALNRSAVSGRVVMARAVASDLGIKQTKVREEIVITEAKPGREVAQLTVRGRRLPLVEFRARGPEPSRGRGRGVAYRLPGGAGRIPNAFITTVGQGRHRGVFVRRSAARLPIRELFGPSLPHVFAKHLPTGQERAKQAIVKNLRSEMRFALSR